MRVSARVCVCSWVYVCWNVCLLYLCVLLCVCEFGVRFVCGVCVCACVCVCARVCLSFPVTVYSFTFRMLPHHPNVVSTLILRRCYVCVRGCICLYVLHWWMCAHLDCHSYAHNNTLTRTRTQHPHTNTRVQAYAHTHTNRFAHITRWHNTQTNNHVCICVCVCVSNVVCIVSASLREWMSVCFSRIWQPWLTLYNVIHVF